jgi:hypothetical protein
MISGSKCADNLVTYVPLLKENKSYRMIAFSLRGHSLSTPYTDAELEAKLRPTEMATNHTNFVGLFLKYAVEQLHVPPKGPVSSTGKRSGGFTLLGWSQGCVQLLLLATLGIKHFDFVEPLLKKYLSAVVFWEPPLTAVYVPV